MSSTFVPFCLILEDATSAFHFAFFCPSPEVKAWGLSGWLGRSLWTSTCSSKWTTSPFLSSISHSATSMRSINRPPAIPSSLMGFSRRWTLLGLTWLNVVVVEQDDLLSTIALKTHVWWLEDWEKRSADWQSFHCRWTHSESQSLKDCSSLSCKNNIAWGYNWSEGPRKGWRDEHLWWWWELPMWWAMKAEDIAE